MSQIDSALYNNCNDCVTLAMTKKETKKEINSDVVGPALEEKPVEEQCFAERANVSESIDNRTVVRNEITTCKFKGVDTNVGEDSGSDEALMS